MVSSYKPHHFSFENTGEAGGKIYIKLGLMNYPLNVRWRQFQNDKYFLYSII
jgi:hypothetical protein